MPQYGEVISYLEMCRVEGVSLQRGMNYHLHGEVSVILMSVRPGAPYADRVEGDGRILIYEGHDVPRSAAFPDPKAVDQPLYTPTGRLTQNGRFHTAACMYKQGTAPPALVRVYEKIRDGIWVYNGTFRLVDAWQETGGIRQVVKFRLELIDEGTTASEVLAPKLEHDRLIPSHVKLAVWQRDKGQCVKCGRRDNLHFDHIIPFSKGGSSLVAENIQLMCARHNLQKRDRIE